MFECFTKSYLISRCFFQKRFLWNLLQNTQLLFSPHLLNRIYLFKLWKNTVFTLKKKSSAEFCQHKLWPILYCEFDRPTFQSCATSDVRHFLRFEVLKRYKQQTSNTSSFHPPAVIQRSTSSKMNATLWMCHHTLHFFCWLQGVHYTTTSHL